MSSIAFFSDDGAAVGCAVLTALGLAEIGAHTIVAARSGPAGVHGIGSAGPVTFDLGGSADAHDIGRAADFADRSGSDLVAALPLSRIADAAVRARFDAMVAVGDGPAAAARALRVARYDVEATRAPDRAPAWFLARADQPLLLTKARLRSTGGPRLPFAARALPFALPRLTTAERDGLLAGTPGDAVLGAAVLLAALVLAIGEDPSATRMEASDLAAMMADGSRFASRAGATRLAALAHAYARVVGEPSGQGAPRPVARHRDRRPPAAAPARAVRQAAPGHDRRLRRA